MCGKACSAMFDGNATLLLAHEIRYKVFQVQILKILDTWYLGNGNYK